MSQSSAPRVTFLFVCVALVAVAAWLAGCGSGSSTKTNPAVTGTPGSNGAQTADRPDTPSAVTSPALLAALLDQIDVPAGLSVRQKQPKTLQANDVPGLKATASAAFITLASSDGSEFVNEVVVLADSRDAALVLLDQFTPETYMAGLTGGASDATATAGSLPSAPIGAKTLVYGGTVRLGGTNQHLDGTAIAFVRGRAFAVIAHGMYAPSPRNIDPAAVAAALDRRLSAEPDTN